MTNRIRFFSAALLFLLAGAGLAHPVLAADTPKQAKYMCLQPRWLYPDKTLMERMQITQEVHDRVWRKMRVDAGQVINYGGLEVTSNPPGAGVLANSFLPLGPTPFVRERLETGSYRVTVRKEGYYDQVRMAEVTQGQTSKLHFTLKPIPYAHFTVDANPRDTTISVIGVPGKYAPGMKLKPGDYLVQLSHPMYGKGRLWARLGPDENLTLPADLAARFGKLKVTAKQDGTTVYLDGQEAGSAPLTLTGLLPGPHKLQVWKSLFKPTTRLVLVPPVETVTEHIDLAPAKHFANSLGMEFVEIPAGSFIMGYRDSPEEVLKRIGEYHGGDEVSGEDHMPGAMSYFPRHLVVISRPFFMQTTEVTRAQWLKVMGKRNYSCDFRFLDRPVILEYRRELLEFIAAMNRRDQGKVKYRLPTEAEWEYAARAGTTSPYFTGETVSPQQAAFRKKERKKPTKWHLISKDEGWAEVKKYPPNPWGLYDTMGNAWEPCADSFDYYFYTRSPIVDPACQGDIFPNQVKRGGHYFGTSYLCATAWRSFFTKKLDERGFKYGIRLVAEPIFAEDQALK